MKRILFLLSLFVGTQLSTVNGLLAQTEVTNKYIDNPNFEARFAGWVNENMSYNTSKAFAGQDGMVFMEKWVSGGSTLGSAASIYQVLEGLPAGTYTLTANAHNIQQSASNAARKGAFVFGGDEQTEVGESGMYTVTFTTLTGRAEVGFRLKSCTGNWACVDNFHLYFDGVNKDSINLELQKIITEAESVVGEGVTGPALQTAIEEAKALLTTEGDYQAAAQKLERATLEYRIENATGTAPKVTTWDFVPTGVTIALGRMTVTGTSKERGFCWSTHPNPTVLDNRSTRYFTNNGNIYCMEHLQPATVYYVRPYAMTSGYKVGYGEVVKIATLPKGNVTTSYEDTNNGGEQVDFRIKSAVNEVQWLYDHLANIRGFNLQVHYVPGSGAGGGTAECSYGGWMNVSQNVPYQQTGTILHETNHGVGVGTTGEWYNNSNLRAETSRGLWLGPRANKVIQFLENSKTATLTGDGTHMWPYGINGANEDQYNPENTLLYYANVLTTHALHQDGLICSQSVGFATPAYVFQQEDETVYYIKSEDSGSSNFLTISSTGALSMQAYDPENAEEFGWHITYDPSTSLYMFQHIATGKYISYSTTLKGQTRTNPTTSEKFHLLPGRIDVSMGSFKGTGFWVTKGASVALQAGASTAKKASLDFSNAATEQRWLFLTEEDMGTYNAGMFDVLTAELDELIAKVETLMQTPHEAQSEEADVTTIDNALTTLLSDIKQAKTAYTTLGEVKQAISDVQAGMLEFLAQVRVTDMAQPFALTFLLKNPAMDEGSKGWSIPGTISYSCCEFYQKIFDFNQTTEVNLPAGTYELRVQAYQRPGSADNVYTDYITNGTNKVSTLIYAKTRTQKVKNIWEDAQKKSLGGNTKTQGGLYVPDNMLAASKWFDAGWYDNSVMVKATTAATMKVGIRCNTSNDGYWSIFDNFRLFYYGNHEIDYITAVEPIAPAAEKEDIYYDLAGRRVSRPSHGLYILNGKKIMIK